ncbi:Pericentrin [Sarcoptes scabiei]|nr:Pericentrin [Sarcoptes scabiei]
MNSLDEFQYLESMIKRSEENLKRKLRKPRTHSLDRSIDSIQNDSFETNKDMKQMRLLKQIIASELVNHKELNHRDELIKKLCQNLFIALKNNEEIKKSECIIANELKDMKNEMQQFSDLMIRKCNDQKNKTSNQIESNGSTKQVNIDSECQTDFNHNEDESSLELCRKQILCQSSFLSQFDYNHIDMTKNDECDKSLMHFKNLNGFSHLIDQDDQKIENQNDVSNQSIGETTTNVQMLINQIRALEEKIQIERQSYLEENEKLNHIIDEKQKQIKDLEQYRKEKNQKSSNSLGKNVSLYIDNSENPPQGYNSQTNNRLLVVLSDLVKTFLDTEQDIHKQLETLGFERNTDNAVHQRNSPSNNNRSDDPFQFSSLEEERLLMSNEITTFDLCEDGPDLTSPSSVIYSLADGSNCVANSRNLSNNNFDTKNNGTTLNDVEDDVVLGASRRLSSAVERVLKILAETLNQRKNDYKEVLQQKNDLSIEIQEECERNHQLAKELIEKENRIKILETEQKTMKDQLVDYEEIKIQHERLKKKVEEYELEREQFQNDNKRLEMERRSFDQGLPQLHQKLLHENESLSQDINQLRQEIKSSATKINNLISDVENLRAEKEQLIEKKNIEFEELISQIDSKEKNLSSLKRFIEEQTQERETERDEFGREVSTIKEKLKDKIKIENRLRAHLRSLESQISLLNEEKQSKDEQIEQINNDLKESNQKFTETNSFRIHLEKELQKNLRLESDLRERMRKLASVLQVKLNDEADWSEVITAIDNFVQMKNQQLLNNMQTSIKMLNKSEPIELNAQQKIDLDNSIFETIKLMDDKIQDLNKDVDSLLAKNEDLRKDLEIKIETIKQLEELKPKIELLEKNLNELNKTNELLQHEINESHLKYSELKVKLDSSIDINEFKRVVNELQTKLKEEKTQTETFLKKYEQANRNVIELNEKLDAYKKEIKSFKELFKSYDQEKSSTSNVNGNKMDHKQATNKIDRRRSKDLSNEIGHLSNQLTMKDRTISLLEQNLEILKTKLESITKERDLYLDRIKSNHESKEKVILYEKNMDKLRLQNKIYSDKITYLELEIKNFKTKIDLLEKENDSLKIDNQKLIKNRQLDTVMMSDMLDGENAAVTNDLNGGPNLMNGHPIVQDHFNPSLPLQLNGFDKINQISSSNLLKLKVRRLLTHKNALIYQKNYLIHVLGSYQRTENDTLDLLANFNNSSKDGDSEDFQRLRGKSKFRSIVMGLIALNRMKFMVNNWKCCQRQLLFLKTANSITNFQNVPIPPRKPNDIVNGSSINQNGSKSPPFSMNEIKAKYNHQSQSHKPNYRFHLIKNDPLQLKYPSSSTNQINSTLKDYVDRLHSVHETLGLHTNSKRL